MKDLTNSSSTSSKFAISNSCEQSVSLNHLCVNGINFYARKGVVDKVIDGNKTDAAKLMENRNNAPK